MKVCDYCHNRLESTHFGVHKIDKLTQSCVYCSMNVLSTGQPTARCGVCRACRDEPPEVFVCDESCPVANRFGIRTMTCPHRSNPNRVVAVCFLVEEGQSYTPRQIASLLEIPQSEVNRIHRSGMNKIRKMLESIVLARELDQTIAEVTEELIRQ